jgi:hypothetical protein
VREQTGKFAQRVASAQHGWIINEMGTLLQETPLPPKRIGKELTVNAFLRFLNVGSALILWKLKLTNYRSPPLIAPCIACDLRFLFHLANAAITGLLSQVFIINSSRVRIRR